MDRGLQERLVGAAVLVALGVWLIPWVLDGSSVADSEPEKIAQIQLPVPESSSGSVIRRQTIDLSGERGGVIKSQSQEAAEPPASVATASNESERSDAPAAAVTEPAVEPRGEPQAQPDAASTPQVATTTPQRDPAPTGNDAQPAAATTRDASAATPQTALSDILKATPVAGWMVQLGSFSDAGNARRQAQRIETYGHDARIYEFAAAGGRTMFRVRLGPLETRERAQATASSLAAHGFVAQLVAPE